MAGEVYLCASSRCWGCGLMVDHKPPGGPQRSHWCQLRWLSRLKWRHTLEGWHSGYRFGIENWGDEMVQADVEDYGRGWAGYMRTGDAIRIDVGDGP